MQRIVRGRLHRVLVAAVKRRHHYETVFLPLVVRLQAVARGKMARPSTAPPLDRNFFALSIQWAYRRYRKSKRIIETKLEEGVEAKKTLTVLLQRTVRMFLAKIKFRRMYLLNEGKRLRASKMILHCWRAFLYRRKYEKLLSYHRLKLFASKLVSLENSRHELEEDLNEIRSDLDNISKVILSTQQRINAIREFLLQVENRLPKIVKHLQSLDEQDFSHNWEEALSQEHESLSRRYIHAKEELRMLRHMLINKRKEQLRGFLEQEEAEIELEGLCILEVETYENIRRNHLQSIGRQIERTRAFKVRREKCFWRLENLRRTVIEKAQRNTKANLYKQVLTQNLDYIDLLSICDQAKLDRGEEYGETVSYEKKRSQLTKEKKMVAYLDDQQYKKGLKVNNE